MVDRKENYKFDLGVKELITGIITDLLFPQSAADTSLAFGATRSG